MPHIPRRRLLHDKNNRRNRSIWKDGRFHYFTRDISNIRGTGRNLVRSRMDATREEELGVAAAGARTWKRDTDG